jgi:hypothetical protein
MKNFGRKARKKEALWRLDTVGTIQGVSVRNAMKLRALFCPDEDRREVLDQFRDCQILKKGSVRSSYLVRYVSFLRQM